MLILKDLERKKAVFRLSHAVKHALQEASKQFPEGGSKETKREWCRVTTLMIVELVKRKDAPYKSMVKRAKKRVRDILAAEEADRLLKQDFPLLELPNHPEENPKQEHQEDSEQ